MSNERVLGIAPVMFGFPAYNFAFAATSIAGPNVLLKDKDSPYRFTAKQMGPHLPGGSAMQLGPVRRCHIDPVLDFRPEPI